jgi:hypothetical protein
MPLPVKKVLSGLRKIDAQETQGRRHKKYIVWVDDEKAGVVSISHGRGDTVSDNILKWIAKELKITQTQFRGIVRCDLYRQDYEALWRSSPYRRRT